MVVGLGVDIIQNSRMVGLIDKWGEKFISKVFTELGPISKNYRCAH